MTKLQALKVAALASACLLQLTAVSQAQDDSGGFDVSDAAPAASQAAPPPANSSTEVTIGIGGVSDKSAAFGRYNGMSDSGAGFLGGWNVQNRDPWDSGGNHYFSFTGDNVNFGFGHLAPEAAMEMKIGHQGEWGITAGYDAMTYTATDNFLSILDKSGRLSPGYQAALIANGVYFNGATTAPPSSAHFGAFNGTTHIAASSPVTIFGPGNQLMSDVGTRRDKGTIEGKYEIGSWLVTAGVSHEHKEGTLEQAMTTGGNNAGMVTFPMPVNYDTDNYTVAAAYNGEKLQASLSYEFSNFIDHNSAGYQYDGWNFAAYKDTSVTPNTYTSFAKSGNYALPPNNQAHTVTGQVGYSVNPTTRLNGTLVYGVQLQNDPFVPATTLGYFGLPAAASLAAQLASNPASLNGEVQTFFGNVAVVSRPLPKLDVRASYTVDVRDPQTNAMWIYGDPTDANTLKYRQAVPASWTKQAVVLSAGYRIMPATRVTVGYAYRNDHRGNAITHDTEENEGSVKLHSMLSDNVTGALDYVHSDRTASAPDWSLWLVQIVSDCGKTLDTLGCQQVPFYQAARTQDAVSGRLSAAINPKATVNLFGKYSDDQYHIPNAILDSNVNPGVGINHDYSIQAGPDLTYQIDNTQEVHAFYTFLRTYRDMRALADPAALTGTNTDYPNATPTSSLFYNVASTYDIQTFGIGGTWQANPRLKVNADYTYSYGDQGFRQSGAWTSGEGHQDYGGDPSLKADSADHQVRINAMYDYSPTTSFGFGYRFDSLDMTDWALVGASVGQVLTGDVPAKYDVHTIMAAMTVKM